MKKLLTVCAFALLVTLSGCKDATTSLSDGNDALITVGNTTITKNDVYTGLKSENGVTAIISKLTAYIVDQEVPVTDEMMSEAQSTMQSFKDTVGEENWSTFLSNMGYENEQQYLEERALLSVRASQLTSKYITDNYDEIKENYQIRKLRIFQTTDSSIAAEVQEKVKNGELTIEEAVNQYDSVTTTYDGSEQILTNASGLGSDIWENIMAVTEDNTLLDLYQYSSDLSNFYVIEVVSVDVPLEEAQSTIEGLSTIADDAFAYYLDKYNFTVYDIDLYNGIQSQKASYIVQDN
ncbi:hypothetical protein [Traorella massiliensis]|uniref:hypothetical protein n=1 Tax=Traorella massiliensis TaxID=1903263 RepID=UPI00248DA7F9|nr:hypothetical protein [Traorella massiliensis]